jgi:phage gpG-like protein
MPFKLEFKLEPPGDKPLRRAFVLYKRIEDLTPAWQRMIPALQDYIARRIASGGTLHNLPPFAPLSPRYARYKARRYPGAPILVRSGRLRNALTQPDHPDAIADMQPDRLTFGTRIPYALYHQLGTRKMPARPPIKLSKPIQTQLLTILRNYLIQEGESNP